VGGIRGGGDKGWGDKGWGDKGWEGGSRVARERVQGFFLQCLAGFYKIYIFKRTLPCDFRLQNFFMNQLPPSP
jgi:hypothetical protein